MALDVKGINAAAYLPERLAAPGPYPVQIFGESVMIDSPLKGEHQQRNLALAVASAVFLASEHKANIDAHAIAVGVTATCWPGRLERLAITDGRVVLIDVAHNPAGAWTLRSYLSRAFAENTLSAPRTLVFSALRDKSIREMAQIVFPLFDEPGDRILLAPVANLRAATASELAAIAADLDTAVTVCSSVLEAMQQAADRPGSTVVAGSVYLAGEAKSWLANHTPEAQPEASHA